MNEQKRSSIGIIIPVFNEETIIEVFHHDLLNVLKVLENPWKIYYVNDGSTDQTEEIIINLSKENPKITLISLTRNFGHQAALSCGIDYATEDIIITMDGDGQNPPEVIPEMLSLHKAGYDIVIGQRQDNSSESKYKNISSKFFYQLLNRIGEINITPNAADFRLLSRKVVDSIKSMPEYHRFLRGMINWLGYKTIILPFSPKPRLGGHSKYTFKKMAMLASDAIFSFSLVPLKIGLAIGGLFFLLAFLEVLYVTSLWLTGNQDNLAPGWSSLMFIILLVGGTLTTVVSLLGIYIGYIFQEVKNRPIYIINDIHQVEEKQS